MAYSSPNTGFSAQTGHGNFNPPNDSGEWEWQDDLTNQTPGSWHHKLTNEIRSADGLRVIRAADPPTGRYTTPSNVPVVNPSVWPWYSGKEKSSIQGSYDRERQWYEALKAWSSSNTAELAKLQYQLENTSPNAAAPDLMRLMLEQTGGNSWLNPIYRDYLIKGANTAKAAQSLMANVAGKQAPGLTLGDFLTGWVNPGAAGMYGLTAPSGANNATNAGYKGINDIMGQLMNEVNAANQANVGTNKTNMTPMQQWLVSSDFQQKMLPLYTQLYANMGFGGAAGNSYENYINDALKYYYLSGIYHGEDWLNFMNDYLGMRPTNANATTYTPPSWINQTPYPSWT